jgi:MFS family permease
VGDWGRRRVLLADRRRSFSRALGELTALGCRPYGWPPNRPHERVDPRRCHHAADRDAGEATPRGVRPLSASGGSARSPWYTLSLLILCHLFNDIDRNILSIVAEDIKSDLGLSDARIGFLYGTTFSVFYVVFGITFGRLADGWVRKNVIAIGLFGWSLMTALSGTARSFAALATCRVGVGIGEASLSPAAHSMLFDVFPKRLRATALSLYHGGGFLGAGASFLIGGLIVDRWKRIYPDAAMAPLHLHAWQVVLFAVGLPGLALAFWMWTLEEPRREGAGVDAVSPSRPRPLRELMAILPPFTLFALARAGAGARGVLQNLAGALFLALAAVSASAAFGETAQWVALAAGLYAAGSWAQDLRLRDRSTFDHILGNAPFRTTALGFGTMSFVSSGLAFWTAPFLLRAFGATSTRVGALIGIGAIVGGWIGATGGGVLSDRLKARRASGRIEVGLLSAASSVPLYYTLVRAPSLGGAFVGFLLLVASVSLWIGVGATSINELVPARMRSTASAVYMLMTAFVGFALGPFVIGRLSDVLAHSGQEPARALGNAMFLSTSVLLISVVLLLRARRLVGPAEERLRAASSTEAST